MKIPTIQVPVHIFLDLVRAYKEQPQELLNVQIFLEAGMLERKAYRKYLVYKKASQNEQK